MQGFMCMVFPAEKIKLFNFQDIQKKEGAFGTLFSIKINKSTFEE